VTVTVAPGFEAVAAAVDAIGTGGLGGQWAAAQPDIGLAWAFLTERMGEIDRAQAVEDALVEVISGRA